MERSRLGSVSPRRLTVEDARARLEPALRRHGVQMALVFGSVARGEPSPPSDLDLIPVKQTKARFLDRYEGLLPDLSDAMGGPAVDVLIYTPEEFSRMRSRRFIRRALAEGKVIYESD